MTDALTRLAEKVEAGEWDQPVAWKVFGIGQTGRAERAFNGSLDAAMALHKSVLGDGNIQTPGYMACVWMSGKVKVWDIIGGASHWAEINPRSLHDLSPARAWLLAILRALAAGETP